MRWLCVTLLVLAALALAQVGPPAFGRADFHQRRRAETEVEPPRLPDGRNQTDEILKAEHRKSLEEAEEMRKLAEELKAELEKNDRHVVSVSSIKKTEQIEKLAKRIRSRLRRY